MSRKIMAVLVGCSFTVLFSQFSFSQVSNKTVADTLGVSSVANVTWLEDLRFADEEPLPARKPNSSCTSCGTSAFCTECTSQNNDLAAPGKPCCPACQENEMAVTPAPSIPFLNRIPPELRLLERPGVDFQISPEDNIELEAKIVSFCDLGCTCPDCVEPGEEPADLNDRNGQMAMMLHAALQSCRSENEAINTIKRSMDMVSRQTRDNFKTDMALLQIAHQKELGIKNAQIFEMQGQLNTIDALKKWLGPLYTNQNRNYQQLQLIASGSADLNRMLNLLEKSADRKSNQTTQSLSAGLPSINLNDQMSKREVDDLRRQIRSLEIKLYEMERNPLRTAQHLEPLYESSQPLRPITPDTYHFRD